MEALIAGLPTSFEINLAASSLRNHVGFRYAPGVVDRALSTRSTIFLGDTGLTDLTVLIGYFTCISLTSWLTTFPPVPLV